MARIEATRKGLDTRYVVTRITHCPAQWLYDCIFPDDKTDGLVAVSHEVEGTNWKLSVADTGTGKPDLGTEQPKGRSWNEHHQDARPAA